MSSLANIPKQSYFSAQLQSPIEAAQTDDIILTDVPDYSPTGETVYFNILDSGRVETISATGWDSTTKELSGVTRAVATYTGETAVGYAHAAGVTVVLADDWKFWEAIQTAVNSKFDTAGGTITGPTAFSGASTTFRIPNLTTVQKNAIASPANGMLVYDTDLGEFQYYDGGAWQAVGTASVPNASTTVAGVVELATAAQRAAGTAVGETGAVLIPTNDALVKTSSGAGDENKIAILDNTGQFATGFVGTATPTASKIPIANATGKIDNGWLLGPTSAEITAGETINGSTAPVPVYKKIEDGEYYASDANDGQRVRFDGFSISNGTDGQPMIVQFAGVVSGFSGLTPSVPYFLSDTVGQISASPGSFPFQVGKAISATEIQIEPKYAVFEGDVLVGSLDTERNSATAEYTKVKEFYIAKSGTYRVKFDLNSFNNTASAFGRVYKNGTAFGTERITASSGYTTYSEDLYFNEGDLCQLYYKTTGGANENIRNFRLYVGAEETVYPNID